MADGVKVSALPAATDAINAEMFGIQGGANKRFAAPLLSTIPDGSVTTAKMGGDVTPAGKSLLMAATVEAQHIVLNSWGRALATPLIMP